MAIPIPIIEDVSVTAIIAVAHANFARFHDVYDGLTWRLARDPIPTGAIAIAPGVYVVKTKKINNPGFCQILAVYSINQNSHGSYISLNFIRVT